MIQELTYALKYVSGRDLAGREVAVFPDDTFIVSYPKSGNTWTRFLVANLIHPQEPVTFLNVEHIVSNIYAQSKKHLKSLPRPRIMKSHEYFDPRYKRVIYIVRDARDVALSYYHFQVKLGGVEEGYPIEQFVQRFVSGDLEQLQAHGTWGENVGSWLATRQGHGGFLLLRYEDMLKHPERELAKVASFLGLSTTPELLAQAVERSAADRLRTLERTQGSSWIETKKGRQDIPFVRAARAGGWKTGLPEVSVAQIESAWGHLMAQIGYELAATVPPVPTPVPLFQDDWRGQQER